MRAVLTIAADTSAVDRAFGRIRAVSRQTQQGVASDAKAAGDAQVRAANASVTAQIRALSQIRREAALSAQARTRLEQQATQIATQEAAKRGLSATQEAQVRQRALEQLTGAYVREENKRTQATRRAAADRARIAEQFRAGVGRVVGGAAGFAMGAGTAMIGDVNAARSSRANALAPLTSVFRQTGAGVGEAREQRRMLQQVAEANGIPAEVLAQAAAGVQGTFSTLSGDTPAERSRRFRSFLQTAVEGQTVVGTEGVQDYVNLSGLIDQIGGSDAQRRAARMGMAHLAELGAVELRTVSREGMAPLMAQVGQAQGALGPNATEDQRIAAGHNALIRGMAEMEVMRGVAGYTPRRAGNIFAAMAPYLAGDVGQHRVLTNIRNAHGMSAAERAAVENQLFEGDAQHRRLRAGLTDPTAFVAAAGRALANNPTALANLFSGGGHGNPQALRENWRNLSAQLLTRGGEHNEFGYERVDRFTRAAAEGISDEDMKRRAELTRDDPATQLRQQEERRANALTDNTNAVVQLADALKSWQADHPFMASALPESAQVALAGMRQGETGLPDVRENESAAAASRRHQEAANAGTEARTWSNSTPMQLLREYLHPGSTQPQGSPAQTAARGAAGTPGDPIHVVVAGGIHDEATRTAAQASAAQRAAGPR